MSAFDVRELLRVAAEPAPSPDAEVPAGGGLPAEATVPARRNPALSPVVLTGLVRAFEFVMVAGLGLGLEWVQLAGVVPLNLRYVAAIAAVAAVCLGLFQAAGAYRFAALRNFPKTAVRLIAVWSLTFLMVVTAMMLAKVSDNYSRAWMATWFVVGLGCILLGRVGLAAFIAAQMRQGRFERRTAIVGGGPDAEALIRALDASGDGSIRIVGVFDDRGDDRAETVVAGYPKLGTVADLVAYARRSPVDLVVFTIPISAETRILQMLAKLWVLPIDIRLSAQATKLRLRPRAYSYLGTVPLLDVFDRPLADWDVIAKAAFDRSVGLALCAALLPVMVTVALAVRLTSRGPILFRQKRHGFNNELIDVLKFRSMYVDQCDPAAARQVTRGDPRVTPVGRFIRKTSLDELPQLFNVVRGNLSLVGPRPHALGARAANTLYDQVVDGYFARHKVKPGITGWAQINGWRGETDTSEKLQRRVEHDLYYIENWSIAFDLQILLTTPFALLKTENAY